MKLDRSLVVIFSGLLLAYMVWWLAIWPGVLGQDSLAVLLQIEGGAFQSRKPLLWYLFVKGLYEPTRQVEWIIGLQLLVSAAIFARILSWCWRERLRKTFLFLLLFVCLGAPILHYAGALYSDGPFAIAVAGLTFEAWLVVRSRQLSRTSLLWMAFLFPVALFFRANGIFMLAIVLPLLLVLGRTDRWRIAAVALGWCVAAAVIGKLNRDLNKHDALFPIAIFETVNFIQPRAMGLKSIDDLVTPGTRQVLERKKPIPDILAHYDRDYWDPLVYRFGGPAFLELTDEDKDLIVREFFCCNLWKNLPAFLGSRVNVFMVSALAQGGFGGLDEVKTILPRTHSISEVRRGRTGAVGRALRGYFEASFAHRWILWTPFLGIALLLALVRRGLVRRDWPLALVCLPLLLQLAGIFLFSIAGEYRYLLPFVAGTAALLPMYVTTRHGGGLRTAGPSRIDPAPA